MNKLINIRFLKYSTVGGIGMLVDIGLLALLVETSGIDPETSWLLYLFVSISFLAAVFNNYILNAYWTFDTKTKGHIKRFVRFFIISVIGLLLSNAFMFVFVPVLGLWYLFAKLITTALVLVWNYSANTLWTFRD